MKLAPNRRKLQQHQGALLSRESASTDSSAIPARVQPQRVLTTALPPKPLSTALSSASSSAAACAFRRSARSASARASASSSMTGWEQAGTRRDSFQLQILLLAAAVSALLRFVMLSSYTSHERNAKYFERCRRAPAPAHHAGSFSARVCHGWSLPPQD